jgi:hypothetical protein
LLQPDRHGRDQGAIGIWLTGSWAVD